MRPDQGGFPEGRVYLGSWFQRGRSYLRGSWQQAARVAGTSQVERGSRVYLGMAGNSQPASSDMPLARPQFLGSRLEHVGGLSLRSPQIHPCSSRRCLRGVQLADQTLPFRTLPCCVPLDPAIPSVISWTVIYLQTVVAEHAR